jgi:hypothetical protein
VDQRYSRNRQRLVGVRRKTLESYSMQDDQFHYSGAIGSMASVNPDYAEISAALAVLGGHSLAEIEGVFLKYWPEATFSEWRPVDDNEPTGFDADHVHPDQWKDVVSKMVFASRGDQEQGLRVGGIMRRPRNHFTLP